jgi:hypothetical protein
MRPENHLSSSEKISEDSSFIGVPWLQRRQASIGQRKQLPLSRCLPGAPIIKRMATSLKRRCPIHVAALLESGGV